MKLTYKFILILLFLSVLPLFVVTTTVYNTTRLEIEKSTLNQLAILASARESRINVLLESYRSQLFDISKKYELRNELRDDLDSNSHGYLTSISILEKEMIDKPYFKSIHLLKPDGEVIWSSDKSVSGTQAGETFYTEGIRRESLFLTSGRQTEDDKLYLTSRVLFEGKIIGLIVLAVDPSDLYFQLSDYTGLGKTGEIVLAKQSKSGNAMVINSLRSTPDSAFTVEISSDIKSNPTILALTKTEEKLSMATDYKGSSVLAVTRYIDLGEWGMVFKIDRKEALASVNTLRNIFILILSMAVITVCTVAYFIVREMNQIIRKFLDMTENIAKGDFEKRLEIASHDELGNLAATFNSMALRLKNYYKDLEVQVKTRTLELKNKVNQTEEQNRTLAQNKITMESLLEDAKKLENELKKEKIGVEKKVEERTSELSKTKAKLDSSIENLPLGFFMIDINEELIVTNSLANNILGGKNKRENLSNLKLVLGKNVDLDKYIKNCGVEKKRLSISDIEIGGRIYQFFLSPILTQDMGNVCIGIVVLIQDVTDEKNLNRSKDEFFSIASHELRTPLTAIRGNTSMILEYYADTIKEPELKAIVDDIHESSIRLIHIVNDFLNVSRLEQGKMVYSLKTFDLNTLIPETIQEYDVTGSRKKLSIDYINPTKPLPMVAGDPDKTRQVLINLLGNAIKFTTDGGVKITTEVSEKLVKVLVSDTGRGIPVAQQSLLFRKFQQAGSSLFTRDTAGGTGLGLYISKMMMDGMGGKLVLEKSGENVGSVFSFSLPIA